MKIDPVLDLGLRHFVIPANASGELAGDGFNVGRHTLHRPSIWLYTEDPKLDFCPICDWAARGHAVRHEQQV
jgi:hypothetical protein